LVLHQNLLNWKGNVPKHTIFQSLPPNNTNQMLHYVLQGQICGAPHPAVEKSNQEDLLSDSMKKKVFFPSDILAYHLKD
jgi:hypothetical protein